MASCRNQALIDVPLAEVWELVRDVNRHSEWWPRVVEARCDGIEQGCTYRQVTASLVGTIETDVIVERLEDCREVRMRCLDTGTYTRWLLTETREGTFVDAEFGMDPRGAANRVFDVLAGKRYFRSWLEQSLDALRVAAGEGRAAGEAPPPSRR